MWNIRNRVFYVSIILYSECVLYNINTFIFIQSLNLPTLKLFPVHYIKNYYSCIRVHCTMIGDVCSVFSSFFTILFFG